MRWTKKKRDEFKDEIDLLLAMADMAERPASVTDLREVFGKKYAAYDKHVSVRQFCEAEIVVDGPSMINEVGSDYGDAKFLSGCDPKTDLPKKFNVSLCQVTNGLANFHQLGQFAKVPAGVLLIAGRGPVGSACARFGLRWRVAWPR